MRYGLEHIKTWSSYRKKKRSRKHYKQFACRQNQKCRRIRNAELSWNAKWNIFLGNFQLLHKEVNSQWNKRLIILSGKLINIKRISRLSMDRLDQQLHQQ
jgi:hypothetical protein